MFYENRKQKNELREQLTPNDIENSLWLSINKSFASARSYQTPLEAASRTGLRPLKKYPQLGWGMLIII